MQRVTCLFVDGSGGSLSRDFQLDSLMRRWQKVRDSIPQPRIEGTGMTKPHQHAGELFRRSLYDRQ